MTDWSKRTRLEARLELSRLHEAFVSAVTRDVQFRTRDTEMERTAAFRAFIDATNAITERAYPDPLCEECAGTGVVPVRVNAGADDDFTLEHCSKGCRPEGR